VLVDEDRIAVRIFHHKARGACAAFVRFGRELEPLRLEAALVLAHVGELLDCLSLVVSPWMESPAVATHPRQEGEHVAHGLTSISRPQTQPSGRELDGFKPSS